MALTLVKSHTSRKCSRTKLKVNSKYRSKGHGSWKWFRDMFNIHDRRKENLPTSPRLNSNQSIQDMLRASFTFSLSRSSGPQTNWLHVVMGKNIFLSATFLLLHKWHPLCRRIIDLKKFEPISRLFKWNSTEMHVGGDNFFRLL